MSARKRKARSSKTQHIVPIEIVDRVNRANRIVKSVRTSMAILDSETGISPMVRAALDVAAVELDEAKAMLGKCYPA